MFNKLSFLISTALCLLPGALAWGAAGHEIVATLAQMHLHPSVLPVLCDLLSPPDGNEAAPFARPCHLAPIAAWADRVKREPQYRYTSVLHYVNAVDDSPAETCAFPGPHGWQGSAHQNVLGAVRNTTGLLQRFVQDGAGDLADAADALKFLVHYVGDMHQPLHLTGRLRGGNGARVRFEGRITSLHSVWDGLLLAQSLRSLPYNYTRPLPGSRGRAVEAHLRDTIYDPFIRRVMWEGFGLDDAGRFGDVSEWLACPAQDGEPPSLLQRVQTVLELAGNGSDGSEEDDEVLCPHAWTEAIHELNCALPVWPPELEDAFVAFERAEAEFGYGTVDEKAEAELGGDAMDEQASQTSSSYPPPVVLPASYSARVHDQWVLERLMAMAGIRLAGILNGIVLGGEAAGSLVVVDPIIEASLALV
ncbi:phospholipase C/P1 nuclease [Obba rivulosa]|uniref:Phospholipase C/P1 nuclease n=1 Tax=Obba rivulosa TaxID=1052685 RepID=A0A8E2DQM5_9APHY|nr:phospholipase C/P1 nuclease [Obba rivulosa]